LSHIDKRFYNLKLLHEVDGEIEKKYKIAKKLTINVQKANSKSSAEQHGPPTNAKVGSGG
jgi:hypothetical protein